MKGTYFLYRATNNHAKEYRPIIESTIYYKTITMIIEVGREK